MTLSLGLGLGARPAHAAATCFPAGGGVPGQPGVPDWWTSPAPVDDPRWQGSYGFGHGTVQFNALIDTAGGAKALVLKWHINPDPGLAGLGDQIYVGFYNPTTTVATVFKFTRDTNTTTPLGGSPIGPGVMTASVYQRTGTGLWSGGNGADAGSSGVPFPSEVASKARLDATCTTADPIACDDWALRLRIPTSGAGSLALPDAFTMWYEVVVDHSGSATTTRAKFPGGALEPDETADPLVFPPPEGSASPPSAAWNPVDISGAASCVAGVELENDDITVSNAIGAGTTIDVNSANTFHTKPVNNTTTAYNPSSIKARLRLADWGSAVGDSPRWIEPDPTCAAATGTGAAGSVINGTRFDLTCAWTLTAGQKCDYRPDLFPGCTTDADGPRYHHQCILAELSSNGAPIPFSKSSAWDNFDFDHSSNLERKARLDIGTLTPRDVYVYVRASNMPETVTDAPPPPPKDQRTAAMLDKLGGGIVAGRVTTAQAARLATLAGSGQISYADVAKVMPTYTAYVWHDTGMTGRSASGPEKILEPQPAFTLFVSHDGPLYGWKHALKAVAGGATITEVSKDFFRISVGATGTAEVVTAIEALETPTPIPVPPGWPLWLLILLIVIGLLFLIVLVRLLRRLVTTP